MAHSPESVEHQLAGIRATLERLERQLGRTPALPAAIAEWLHRIRDDDLGYPHRKIMEALLGQYDDQSGAFREVHFSRLVRLARVGKNRANGYLALLLEKGYVRKRSDGYRVFFRLAHQENVPQTEHKPFKE